MRHFFAESILLLAVFVNALAALRNFDKQNSYLFNFSYPNRNRAGPVS